jgi:hypothetical protein
MVLKVAGTAVAIVLRVARATKVLVKCIVLVRCGLLGGRGLRRKKCIYLCSILLLY